MENGEAVFEAPWQGRIFGMAHALADAGLFSWDEFRACLIKEISGWERDAVGEYAYYEHFQRALEGLLASSGLVAADVLESRAQQFATRPEGHDHAHGHSHDHSHDHDHV